jgi:glycine/D-amino acid oxidase-like deaminating enzyme
VVEPLSGGVGRSRSHAFIVVGGGIIGTSAAAMLAEAGAAVTLVEGTGIAAGASGRNSGSLQRPPDRVMSPLHDRTLELYRELANDDPALDLPLAPAGLLLLAEQREALDDEVAAVAREVTGFAPARLDPAEVRVLEPALADGLWGALLPTGYPVPPAAATLAFANRASRTGVNLLVGDPVIALEGESRVSAVRLASGRRLSADGVLVAAGSRTPSLVPGWADNPPIRPVWGVVVSARVENPPSSILEEVGIDSVGSSAIAFSLVTAGGSSSVGSTFLADRPDAPALADELLARGTRFVPGLAHATVLGVRACARPVSMDGRPLVGRVPAMDGLFVCAGHGPWGLSIGPATAEVVVRQMLDGDPGSDHVAHSLAPGRLTDTNVVTR